MVLGEGVRKYSCDTDNIFNFIMSLASDHQLAVLKFTNFFKWKNPYKIAEMFLKK